MIRVNVNGETVTLPNPVTVAQLLDRLGYKDDFVAVAIDRTHVRRHDFATTFVDDRTAVDILAPMAGG